MKKIDRLSDEEFEEFKRLNEVIRNLNELQERVEELERAAGRYVD